MRLSGFNNRSASCNLVRWTFYLSAETKLSLSSSFRPANVIECCVLTAKVIICALVRAISLVPITSQPDRMSLHTPKLYLCYLFVCVAQLLREAFGQIFVPPKNLKSSKRLTFCAVWTPWSPIQNWQVAVSNGMQQLLHIWAPARGMHVSIKLVSQSKPSAPLCWGALRQIRHPEGFQPKK